MHSQFRIISKITEFVNIKYCYFSLLLLPALQNYLLVEFFLYGIINVIIIKLEMRKK